MISWWIYDERIQVQIPLKLFTVESAVRIQKHLEQIVNPVNGVERILAVSQPFQVF